MVGHPGPGADRFDRQRARVRLGFLFGGGSWLVVAVLLIAPFTEGVQRYVAGGAVVLGCLGLCIPCVVRYREAAGRRQVAWMLWSLAALTAAFANGWLTLVGPGSTAAPASPIEVAMIIAMVLATLGFLFFTSTTRTGLGLARMVVDGIVLGGSVILIAQDLLQPQLLAVTGPVPNPVALVVPVVDLVLASVAALQFLRVGRDERPAMGLGAAGFAAFAVSDLATALARAQNTYQLGSPADLGTVAGFSLLALGVAWPVAPLGPEDTQESPRSALRGTLLTFGVFVVAASVHITLAAQGDPTPGSILLLIAVLLGVAARQVLLIVDNERLRVDLEIRVKQQSSELREVTQRTDLMVDSVADGVYGVDAHGRITFVNPAAAQVLGYRPRELMGRSAHETFHTTDDAGQQHSAQDCYVTRVIDEREPVSAVEDCYLAQQGRAFPVEVTASPLARDARVRGAVVVFRDVTQRREVDRLKTEFVSIVSHELKTPLTAIRGSLGLLAGGAVGELAPPARRMVEIAMDSGERLTRLINQILDLERIQSGTLPLVLRPLRAAELFDQAVEQLEVLAEEQQVRFVVVSAEGTVRADADQIDQTLLNLLGNALKFAPPGSEVQLGSAMTGSKVEFWVSDQGRGIPEDQLQSIFVRFHQVDSSDAREKGGTGLGLAISRSIVERHGGEIWAENGPGGGATFRFTLPAGELGTDPEPPSRALPTAGQPVV